MTQKHKNAVPLHTAHQIHDDKMTLITLLTIIAMVLSMMLNAKGLFDKSVEAGVADTIGIISALATAIVAGLLVGAGQIMLFSATINAYRSQRTSIVSLTAVLLIFAYGISAVSNAMASCGAASLVYAMRDRITQYTVYVEQAVAQRMDTRNAADALRPKGVEICSAAEKEASSGLISGSKGYGPLVKNYSGACTSVTKIIAILDERVAESAGIKAEADALLVTLENAVKNSERNVFERVEDFRETAAALRRLVSGVTGQKTDDLLRAQLGILEGGITKADIADGAFGQRQREALAELKASLEHFVKTVNTLLDKNNADTLIPPEDIPDMLAAIWDYKGRNTPQLLISFLIDSYSIYLVFLLGVMRRTAELRREDAEATLRLTA